MKKFSFLMMLLFISISYMNAQIATENSKTLDNIYVGVNGGAITAVKGETAFKTFSPNFGIRVGKDITPVLGFAVEGTAYFSTNRPMNGKTFIQGVNVYGLATANLNNLFAGYKGQPRAFEIIAVGGFGCQWLFRPAGALTNASGYVSKVGADFALNLGSDNQWQVYIEPTMNWALYNTGKAGFIQYNINNAGLALKIGVNYKFKTSNGTRHHKIYNIGEMNNTINTMASELKTKSRTIAEKNNTIAEKDSTIADLERKLNEYFEKASQQTDTTCTIGDYVVNFKLNSYELTDNSMVVLDQIPAGSTVTIDGYASQDGSAEYNKVLSQKRADVTKEYLKGRNVNVKSAEGHGVPDDRKATIKVEK